MNQEDFKPFSQMLDAVYSLHGKSLPAEAKAIFFRSMQGYPLDTVRGAIDAHVRDAQRGQFPPKPADLMHQLEAQAQNDGRPGADEAWSIALSCKSEYSTVCWIEEIAKAYSAASVVLENGDEVGARMAFKETYNRLLAEARQQRKPIKWSITLGWGVEARAPAIERAIAEGKITREYGARFLPAPEPKIEDAPRLAGPEGAAPTMTMKERMEALRALLGGNQAKAEAAEKARQEARDTEKAKKAEIAERVAKHAHGGGK